MLIISTLADIAALRESVDVECKLASGKDGEGTVPKDFWRTYSAFANSQGGEVLLGVKQKGERFEAVGLRNPEKLKQDLFNLLHDSTKVSKNLLRDEDVEIVSIEGKRILRVSIPRAPRKDQPVFLHGNPMTETYRRQSSGDYPCDEETVRRMFAEQSEESRDSQILKGFTFADLDMQSLRDYRQILASRNPDHPLAIKDDQEFLRLLGGWGKDRDAGFEGLTRAGLLMFGSEASIRNAFPNYMLDYQERTSHEITDPWIDRLTLDSSWSGNLFDFYRRVIRKLYTDLKVPFVREGDRRKEKTPVHEALQEALVNALVHADYTGRAFVLVLKRPDGFEFQNPGLMRVPPEVAREGGKSDCRNRTLHQMFRLGGYSDQTGQGVPIIYQSWRSQDWRTPLLQEALEPFDCTRLILSTLGLFPQAIIEQLQQRYGSEFDALPELQRLILATASAEKTVTHKRITELSTDHASDLSKAFQFLCRRGWLKSGGRGRATVYFLSGEDFLTPEQAFAEDPRARGENLQQSRSRRVREEAGWLSVDGLDRPLIDNLDSLQEWIRQDLQGIAAEARLKQKLPAGTIRAIILELCRHHYLTIQVLGELLNRKEKSLSQEHLTPMVRDRLLQRAFPTAPTDPKQAYAMWEDPSIPG